MNPTEIPPLRGARKSRATSVGITDLGALAEMVAKIM
jgi:hypothetical protein